MYRVPKGILDVSWTGSRDKLTGDDWEKKEGERAKEEIFYRGGINGPNGMPRAKLGESCLSNRVSYGRDRCGWAPNRRANALVEPVAVQAATPTVSALVLSPRDASGACIASSCEVFQVKS